MHTYHQTRALLAAGTVATSPRYRTPLEVKSTRLDMIFYLRDGRDLPADSLSGPKKLGTGDRAERVAN